MLLWNEIDYETQVKVMDLVEQLLLKQTEIPLQDGMAAALAELEIWSNSPCKVLEQIDKGWDK
jgi:hypothetical protein